MEVLLWKRVKGKSVRGIEGEDSAGNEDAVVGQEEAREGRVNAARMLRRLGDIRSSLPHHEPGHVEQTANRQEHGHLP